MTPEQIHDKMAAIVNKPGYPLLRHYRDDFEVLDRDRLGATWHDQSRVLWIVREMGTNLVNLGIHPNISLWGNAALDLSPDSDIFLATGRGLAKITLPQARAELSRMDWSLENGRIRYGKTPVADIIGVDIERVDNNLCATVKMHPIKKTDELTHGEAVALVCLAEQAANSHAQTFCRTESIRIGDESLYEIVVRRKDAWMSREAALAKKTPRRQDLFPTR